MRSLGLRWRVVQTDLTTLPDGVGDEFSVEGHFGEAKEILGDAGPGFIFDFYGKLNFGRIGVEFDGFGRGKGRKTPQFEFGHAFEGSSDRNVAKHLTILSALDRRHVDLQGYVGFLDL